MKNLKRIFFASTILGLGLTISCGQKINEKKSKETKDSVETVKPVVINTSEDAIIELKNGNKRFLENLLVNTNYKQRIEETKGGQKPHSVILSCMDSRVPPEIIFDQGIGNIFTIRIAGNIEDENVLGSMEYAVEHAGSKLIVVMGHSHCGAVTGAVKGIKLGNLTQLVDQIKPAMTTDSTNTNFIDETAKNSVKKTMQDLLDRSEIIRVMVHEGKIKIVGAFYDIEIGVVTFME
jgi:carbonic anhydrase